MGKKVTMDYIASLAGVSKATVSRAIHNSNSVRPEKRERILRIMEANDYVYDATAGEFSSKKTKMIGLIIPTITSSIFAASTQGVQELAEQRGYTVILGNSNYNIDAELRILKLFQQRRVAGLILTGISSGVKELVKSLSRNGLPCIVTWEMGDEKTINYVGFDNFKAAFSMTEYLIHLRHKRIGLIVGPYSRVERVRARLSGYRAALEQYGIDFDPSLVLEREYSFIEGKEAMCGLLSLAKIPTAVFAASDVLALGALAGAREKGFRVPEDISVAGFDDIDFAAYCYPPLTTVRVPAYEMGQLAMKVLLKLNQNESTHGRQFMLETSIVVRKSCGECMTK